MHVCLGGLTSGAGVTASPDPAGIVKPRVRDGCVFPPPLPRTNHGAACLTWLNTYMYLQPASTLHSNLSVIYPLLPDVHMSVSE